jgi:hypothetical protein
VIYASRTILFLSGHNANLIDKERRHRIATKYIKLPIHQSIIPLTQCPHRNTHPVHIRIHIQYTYVPTYNKLLLETKDDEEFEGFGHRKQNYQHETRNPGTLPPQHLEAAAQYIKNKSCTSALSYQKFFGESPPKISLFCCPITAPPDAAAALYHGTVRPRIRFRFRVP